MAQRKETEKKGKQNQQVGITMVKVIPLDQVDQLQRELETKEARRERKRKDRRQFILNCLCPPKICAAKCWDKFWAAPIRGRGRGRWDPDRFGDAGGFDGGFGDFE